MYMGQALATITDQSLTPAHHVTPAVALFMFVITIIGGNMPLVVPLVNSWVGYGGKVDISFDAAPVYSGTDGQGKNVKISEIAHCNLTNYAFLKSSNRKH